MAECLISSLDIKDSTVPKRRIFNCLVSSFDYTVSNMDNPDHFAFRMGMLAFMIAKTMLAFIVLGIVWHYERFGGDPCKRTILNQFIGMIFLSMMTVGMVTEMSLMYRLLFGALSMEVTMLTFVATSVISGLFVLLTLNEILIVRCYTLVLLKQLPPINDDFFAMFTHCLNYALSVMFASMGHMAGIPYDNLIFVMTGEYFNKEPLLSAAK